MKKSFKRAGADPTSVGSRYTRRVLVSELRGDEQDPARNLAIAQAASHSLPTADKYYDIRTKDAAFVEVTANLRTRMVDTWLESQDVR